MINMEKGLIQIYTGPGKGKTTAAVGLAVRAIGHDLRVCWVYFHKVPNRWGYNELKVLERLGVKIYGFAEKHPHFYTDVTNEELRKECLKGIEFIERLFKEEDYDLIVLDEIIISIRDGFLKEEEVIDLLDKKPEKTEVVLTGRGDHGRIDLLIQKADLVSKIEVIKHYYDKGVESRAGIEY
jgi:cob(I)alamin adenosyltransferase